MSDQSQELAGRRIARRLDRGGLSRHQAARLAQARRSALAIAGGVAPVSRLRRLAGWSMRPALRGALSLALVLGLALGSEYFQLERARDEAHRLDRALLVDDLPIDAYLDEGFRAWVAAGARS